ncbi:sulfite exporter TauE/SafE family protein [Lujinxingia litoralis]|uniref:Probable membrane transporter protein n=1 Tax=Lujinxingia litoralis TaxID=2211119 RepID=A0A328C4G4_9DELT|nr:sulfite exporter TauE/SafE family protein [Lujinxingia litoralis]RAL20628.1 sulfite exporter TauE/SafE family protein [Lujinxingia litoralis]
MSAVALILAIFVTGFLAGGLGSMVGLGGGVFIVPVLSLVLGVDLKAAIAASAICVVLNSLNGSAEYLRRGLVHIKLALLLQISTAMAAILGGILVVYSPVQTLKLVFAGTLALVIAALVGAPGEAELVAPGSGKDPFGMATEFDEPGSAAPRGYVPQRVKRGIALSWLAGLSSGMLGIGGGAVQVPMMSAMMRVPLRAAAATSTFMVGTTASVSALILAMAGVVDVAVTVPAMAGVMFGSNLGARLGAKVSSGALRRVLIATLSVLTVAMALEGLGLVQLR